MSKLKILVASILLIVSCKENQRSENSEVVIKSDKLNTIIKSYKSFLSLNKEPQHIITVFFDTKNDTTSILLLNTYPDFRKVKFIGIGQNEYISVCFVGEYKPNSLFTAPKDPTIPKFLINKIQEIKTEDSLKNGEPSLWSFRIKNEKIIKAAPMDDILKYCDLCGDK